jgi:CPA1 family monovalent cation:H+ antiporter
MSNSQAFLFFLLLLGSIAVALRLISRNTELIPYQVVLAAAGVGLGFIPGLPIPHVGPDLILLAFVPALVFEAAIGLDLDELWRRLLPVTLLATVGVALTVLGVGLVVHLVLGLTWAAGFLIGAIVAATDPIAVVSLLRRLDAPAGLGAILEGESLFNDGTGVALFSAVLATIVSGSPSLTDAAVRFVVLTAGGAAIGVLIGLGAVAVLRTTREAELEILVTLVAAYGSYLTADVLHVSGVVAVVGAAIVVARFGSRTGRLRGTQLQGFWALLGFVLNAILFMLVGAALPSRELLGLVPLVVGAYLTMTLARIVPVYLLLGLSDPRARRIPWRWRHLVLWGGIRGALGVALALAVAGQPEVDPRVSDVAYGMIILSLFVQGGTLQPIARRLGLAGSASR